MKMLDNPNLPFIAFAFTLHKPLVQYAPPLSSGVIRKKLTKLEIFSKIVVIFSTRLTFCVTSQSNVEDKLRDP